MPLHIVPLDPKENENAVKRASHCPLRFTTWTSPDSGFTSSFQHPPFDEDLLRQIATDKPAVSHLELLVLERGGCAVGYLGHPDEYLGRSWKTPTPRFRAKVISASGRFLVHLKQALLPNILEETLSTIGRRLHLTRKAVDELHRREEEHVRAAHLLMPLCTTLQDVPPSRANQRVR